MIKRLNKNAGRINKEISKEDNDHSKVVGNKETNNKADSNNDLIIRIETKVTDKRVRVGNKADKVNKEDNKAEASSEINKVAISNGPIIQIEIREINSSRILGGMERIRNKVRFVM